MTITIQIGNTDNKLTQQEWAQFVDKTRGYLEYYCEDQLAQVHFFGASAGWDAWQNAAWVLVIHAEALKGIRRNLSALAATYKQDSIALTIGETEFVKP